MTAGTDAQRGSENHTGRRKCSRVERRGTSIISNTHKHTHTGKETDKLNESSFFVEVNK